MNHAAQLRVSVVIPTYQRPHLLFRCLQALLRQDLPPDTYEIIVADDDAQVRKISSLESSLHRLIARTGNHPAIRYVPVTRTQGPAGARNCGWREAWSDVIAFTDDDTVPAPDWLKCGLEALHDTDADAVAGQIHVPLPRRPTDYERDVAGLRRAQFATANCLVHKRALMAIGGFDERFTAAWREDSDLHFSLLRQGFRVACAPRAVVTHPVRPAGWGISLGQQRKVFFDALLYKKHPDLYRCRIRPVPPWHYYVIVAALCIAGLAWHARNRELVAAALLIWLALTAAFCLRRLRRTAKTPRHIAEMVVTSAVIPVLSMGWRIAGALNFRVLFL